MRRSDLLRLTGCPAATLDNLTRRKALPFRTGSQRWSEYDFDHALQLALTLELADAGCDQRSAAGLVRAGYGELVDEATETATSRQDVRFGFVVDWVSGDGETASAIMPLLGRPDQIAARRRTYEKWAREQGGFLRRELTVNVTFVLDQIAGRCLVEELSDPALAKLIKAMGVKP